MSDLQTYNRLFAGYVIGMIASGIVVVALTLVAYDLADDVAATTVISIALAIKTLAYSLGAPLAGRLLARLDRRWAMVGLNVIRAAVMLAIPFAGNLPQFYALIACFALASAASTPLYQATVPLLKPDPDDYVRSVAKSRVANEIENAVSPLLAAALLLVLTPRGIFVAVTGAFLGAAFLLSRLRIVDPEPADGPNRLQVGTSGLRLLITDPAFRGLVPLGAAAAIGTALIMVNTVPLVQGGFGVGARGATLALAAFGVGSVLGALAMPRFLAARSERAVMLSAGCAFAVTLGLAGAIQTFAGLLAGWTVAGFVLALTQLPAAAVIRRRTIRKARLRMYALHFGLGHLLLALAYAAVGTLETQVSMGTAFLLGGIAVAGATAVAAAIWQERHRGGAEGLLQSSKSSTAGVN